MQDESKRLSVSISFGEGGTIYGCGHALDTMLYAHGLNTEDDLMEYVSDRLHESISYILEQYDFEEYTIDALNALPIDDPRVQSVKDEEFLYGDYLKFNKPEEFATIVKLNREHAEEKARDSVGDWQGVDMPSDLIKELTRAYEDIESDAQREWLQGDRSNPGALKCLASALFGRYTEAEVSWEPKTDIVTIDAPGEEWREWLGYELDEREPLPSPEKLGEIVQNDELRRAKRIKEDRQRATLGRVEEYKRREEQKREALEREKADARKRKALKDQAS